MPSDSSSLRECAAKGEGCVIMWKPTTTGMKTWIRDGYGAQAFRTTTSKGPPWQSVVRRISENLNTGEIIEDLAVPPSEQQVYDATVPDGPKNIRTILQYLMRPVAPRERSSDEMQSIYVSLALCHCFGEIRRESQLRTSRNKNPAPSLVGVPRATTRGTAGAAEKPRGRPGQAQGAR